MAKETLIERYARENGLVDDRRMTVCANITCSNGNRGMAYAFLNGSKVHLYEAIGFTKLGEHIETIDMKEVTDFKSCKIILLHYIKFKYNGYKYKFDGFAQPSKVIAAFEECMKM